MAMITGTADFQVGKENTLQEIINIGGINYIVDVVKLTNDSLIGMQAMGVVDVKETVNSNTVTCTTFTNAVLADLTTALNSYLSGSVKKLLDIKFITHSLVAVLYIGVVIERN